MVSHPITTKRGVKGAIGTWVLQVLGIGTIEVNLVFISSYLQYTMVYSVINLMVIEHSYFYNQ
jgi:hypothetical protein